MIVKHFCIYILHKPNTKCFHENVWYKLYTYFGHINNKPIAPPTVEPNARDVIAYAPPANLCEP